MFMRQRALRACCEGSLWRCDGPRTHHLHAARTVHASTAQHVGGQACMQELLGSAISSIPELHHPSIHAGKQAGRPGTSHHACVLAYIQAHACAEL